MLELSNPRTEAVVEDWPSGRRRVTATFTVEDGGKRGFRVARVTTGKPKKTTYHLRMTIVDGDDGRIYALGLTEFGQIVVWPGTLKCPEYIYDTKPEYETYKALLYS